MKMVQVDAFASKPFTGNPAAVLILPDWLDDALMQAIAQENNLAETAFARPRSDGAWDLRWFTPTHEVAFCGHATLATAHVLTTEPEHAHGLPADGTLRFHTQVGLLAVARSADGYCLDVPRLDPQPLDRLPDSVAGLVPHGAALFRNFENLFVDLGSGAAVRQFAPDLTAVARLGTIGLCVTGQGDGACGADFVSRYFVPGAGISEDPVTRSELM